MIWKQYKDEKPEFDKLCIYIKPSGNGHYSIGRLEKNIDHFVDIRGNTIPITPEHWRTQQNHIRNVNDDDYWQYIEPLTITKVFE